MIGIVELVQVHCSSPVYLSGDANDVVQMVAASEDDLFRLISDQEFHMLRPICLPTVD